MNHLYLIDYDSPLKNNGLDAYVEELTRFLMQTDGFELSYVWVNASNHKDFTIENEKGVRNLYIPPRLNNPLNSFQFDFELSELLTIDMNGKENIIVHINWINHCSLAWHLKKKNDCKTILTKHCIPWCDFVTSDYEEFQYLNHAFEKRQNVRITHPQLKLEQINYDFIDHIIVVSDFARQSLIQLFKINADKITVIPNGLRSHKIKSVSNDQKLKLRQKYGFDPEEKIILYAGKISVRKGVMDLVRIFEQLLNNKDCNKVRLVLAGQGDHSQVLRIVKKKWAKITITGSLDKKTLFDFYAMADIGILPSYVEQCSYTAIEMMHSNLPLIVSDVKGLKEMVNDDCGLRVQVSFKKDGASLNTKDVIQRIRFLINNPEEANRLAANAKKYALANFSAERMVNETVTVYEKLLNRAQEPEQIVIAPVQEDIRSKPLVSIVLPCYNGAKYLQACLDSIFKQSYANFELIIVNDGSNDETDQIVSKITDGRLVSVSNRTNKGITYSLNKAIGLAKGQYIARIDADDEMLPDRLRLQVDFLENNPDYGMVGASHYVINDSGMPIHRVEPAIDNNELRLTMLFYNPFAHPVMTMRAEIVKKLNYDSEYWYCEDYELWFRIAEQYKIKNLSVPLLNYRVHQENSSKENRKVMQQNVMMLLSRSLEDMGISHSSEELVLHAAICFGYRTKYFNNPVKVGQLNQWLDRIFAAQKVKALQSMTDLRAFRADLIKHQIGL